MPPIAVPPPDLKMLTATASGDRVVLAWEPPEDAKFAKFYILRFRVNAGGSRSWSRTHFVPPHQRGYVDTEVPSGTWRYLVGTLGPEGSGKPRTVEVVVRGAGASEGAPASVTG